MLTFSLFWSLFPSSPAISTLQLEPLLFLAVLTTNSPPLELLVTVGTGTTSSKQLSMVVTKAGGDSGGEDIKDVDGGGTSLSALLSSMYIP